MTVPKHFMNSAGLAHKYPEAVYPDAVQKEILEYVISAGHLSDEKEAHFRETFAEGKRVYVDRSKVDNLLVKDGRVLDAKDISSDDEYLQTDQQAGQLPIVLVAGKGWYAATHEAVALILEFSAGDWD